MWSYFPGQLKPSEMQKTALGNLGIESSFAADTMELRTAKPEMKLDEPSGRFVSQFRQVICNDYSQFLPL